MSYTHLTPTERGQVQAWLRAGRSQTFIAAQLGRSKSSICRELRRNASRQGYDAQRAQERYQRRREACRPGRKLAHRPLWDYLIGRVAEGWTPETVAGRLPLDYPDDPRMRISHEAIYQAIYGDPRLRFLIAFLPQARPRRRKRGQGKTRRGPAIPDRVGIEHRPAEVGERARYGDWEGDTVVGAGHKGFLVTLVERSSRLLCSRKVKTKRADEVARAVVDALEEMPTSWVRTITFDNGTEFANHKDIAKVLPADIYFAQPYASYQRGTNENTNGLIRRFFPKGTPFDQLSEDELQTVVNLLNNRPRKTLGFRTPLEVFLEQRRKHLVALGA